MYSKIVYRGGGTYQKVKGQSSFINVFVTVYSHFFNFALNSGPRDTLKFNIIKFSSLGTPETRMEPLRTLKETYRK